MKSITMDFAEYEKLIAARDIACRDFERLRRDLEIVYGKEVAESIYDKARIIEESKHRYEIQNLVFNGKL